MTNLLKIVEGRHPSTANIGKWLKANPNLKGTSAFIANYFEDAAYDLLNEINQDSPELTAGLRKLLEAKDCFVRAALDEQPGFWTDR